MQKKAKFNNKTPPSWPNQRAFFLVLLEQSPGASAAIETVFCAPGIIYLLTWLKYGAK